MKDRLNNIGEVFINKFIVYVNRMIDFYINNNTVLSINYDKD